MGKYEYFRSTFYFEGRQYSATGKSQREADRKAGIKLDKMKRGEVGISTKMTVKNWCDTWLTTYKKGNVGAGTYNDYSRRCDMITDKIGSMSLNSVTSTHLQKIVNEKQGNSFSDIDKTMKAIRMIFKQAYLSRLINFDISSAVVPPTGSKGKRRSLTDFERHHILKTAKTHNAGLWVKVLLFAGLRSGESVALLWNDIDLKNGYISINKACDLYTGEIKKPKTESGIRLIPIPDHLIQDLEREKGSPFELVFKQSTTGNMHTTSSLRKMWLSFKKQVDISMGAKYEKRKAKDGKMRETLILSVIDKKISPYYLRHTYCTDLQAKGVDLKYASYIMGHANINITADIYTHITKKYLDDVKGIINTALEDDVKNDVKAV